MGFLLFSVRLDTVFRDPSLVRSKGPYLVRSQVDSHDPMSRITVASIELTQRV